MTKGGAPPSSKKPAAPPTSRSSAHEVRAFVVLTRREFGASGAHDNSGEWEILRIAKWAVGVLYTVNDA
jgi:hypothetical protein